MKSYKKKVSIGLLSLMLVSSITNIFFINNAQTSEASSNPTIRAEAQPVVSPEIITIDKSKASYKPKEESVSSIKVNTSKGLNEQVISPKSQAKWTKKDADRLTKAGLSSGDIEQVQQLAVSLNEEPDSIVQKMKEENKDWDKVRISLLKEKMLALPEALEEKYKNELIKLAEIKVSKKQRLQIISLLELRIDLKFDELVASFQKEGSVWLENELTQTHKDQFFDKERLNKNGLTEKDIEGMDPANLNQLEELAKKTKRPLKELVNEVKKYSK